MAIQGMRVITFNEANNDLDAVLTEAVARDDGIVISFEDGKDAVVISMSHYNGIMETLHLMKTPANAEHLNRSILQYKTVSKA